MKRSWTPPCRRSDRVKTTRPTRWAQEPASLARTPPRTERPRPACWQQPACRPHTPHPPQPHPAHLTHRTQDTPTNREGLRAWPLHSRGTALVPRHEGLARHHHGHDPHEGMSIQRMDPQEGGQGQQRRRQGRSALQHEETRQQKRRARARDRPGIRHRPKRPNIRANNTYKKQHMAPTAQHPRREASTERPR